MKPTIEVRGVRKSYGRTRALQGIDLDVREGQVTGLLGPNGAGKTTLVRILATLLVPDAGQALVGGFDVVRQPARVRRLIGLAGQYALVDEALTGRENLEMVGRLYHLRAADARRQASAVLERLRLSNAGDRPVRTYSGGMRRRLDLGACLVGRPAVLLLDEPTTGLDPAARRELWAYLEELTGTGTSVLLTTQQLDEADQLADNIVIIDRGTVIAEGTPATLKARLGEDRVELSLSRSQLGAAQRALAGIAAAGVPGMLVDRDAGKITLRVPSGSTGLAAAVRALDQAQVLVTDVTVGRPSLDDAFLAITGQRSGPGPESTAGRQPPPAPTPGEPRR